MSKYLNFTAKLIVKDVIKASEFEFMALKDILGKLRGSSDEMEGEEFVEVSPEAEKNQINVKIDTMTSYSDTERVLQHLREGHVIFLRIRELREKNLNELKRAVEKIKKTASAMNGDMVGVDEDFLIITPQYARIYRGQPQQEKQKPKW